MLVRMVLLRISSQIYPLQICLTLWITPWEDFHPIHAKEPIPAANPHPAAEALPIPAAAIPAADPHPTPAADPISAGRTLVLEADLEADLWQQSPDLQHLPNLQHLPDLPHLPHHNVHVLDVEQTLKLTVTDHPSKL